MARSTKTKHVMNLVGADTVKKPHANTPKPAPAEKAPTVPKIVEAVISEAQYEPPPQEKAVQEEAVRKEAVQEQAPPPAEEKEPVHKPKVTAIVCELINQELGSVAERFRLSLTDSNLWALTRAALEEVRPEFSADSGETEEKLERLRPQVIGAMAKAAIKLSAGGRK